MVLGTKQYDDRSGISRDTFATITTQSFLDDVPEAVKSAIRVWPMAPTIPIDRHLAEPIVGNDSCY